MVTETGTSYAYREFDTVYERVENLLETRPGTRNSDRLLYYFFCEESYRHLGLDKKYANVPFPSIGLQALWEVLEAAPDKSTIKRTRARIQNEERRLLPTDPDVLKRRRLRSEDIRDWTLDALPKG